jgi:hypothetical protein
MPILMLLYMSSNRTHFLRTILPVFALVPVFAAVGVDELAKLIDKGLRKIERLGRYKARLPHVATLLTLVFLVGAAGATVDRSRLLERNVELECRDQALNFIESKAEPGQTILVADDLWINGRDLADYRVLSLSPGLENWKTRAGNLTRPTLVLLPDYGKPKQVPPHLREAKKRRAYERRAKRNARAAEKNARRFIERTGARLVETIEGKKTLQVDQARDRAIAISNPEIRIYEIRGVAVRSP